MSSFVSEFKKNIFNITPSDFEFEALSLFRYQSEQNPVYKSFINYLRVDTQKVKTLEQIPFMPVEFFKTQEVRSVHDAPPTVVFESSGTTGSATSKHAVWDTDFYHAVALRHFEHCFAPITDYAVLALLPSYLERSNSSLVYMVDKWIRDSGNDDSGFYLDNWDALINQLKRLTEMEQKVLLIGVSFALLDLADKLDFALSSNITVMETGGMKGRREELTREQLHKELQQKMGVKRIYSEYGMTELMSQAYLLEDTFFHAPAWMRFFVRNTEDPFAVAAEGRGVLNVIDLANVDSCAFIALQDLGEIINASGDFSVLGRMDGSDVRGCSLLYS